MSGGRRRHDASDDGCFAFIFGSVLALAVAERGLAALGLHDDNVRIAVAIPVGIALMAIWAAIMLNITHRR
jgi:hypothetical protein